MNDAVGHALSGSNARALEHLERAFDQLRCLALDPLASADAALAEAPELVMGHALRAYLFLSTSQANAVEPARAALVSAQALPHNPREALHLRALGQWCNGQWCAAARTLENLSVEYPLDALALQMGQQLDFFTGDQRMQHDRIARALPSWSAAVPGWHAVLGMMAFGLEENGHHAKAESLGRAAIELQPRDAWAQHAVVHVLEMHGRREEGIAWMRGQRGWQQDSLLAVHNWWHLALHHLALGDTAQVLDLYDGPIRNRDSQVHLEMIDASALLWRLELLGVDVGDRWSAVAERWAGSAADGWYAFSDWHAAMAFVSAGRQDLLQTLVQTQALAAQRGDDNSRFLSQVGLAATQGFVACHQRDWTAACELLRNVRSGAQRFGGSHAQRDLIDLTLIEAARRSGQVPLANALVQERAATASQRRPAAIRVPARDAAAPVSQA